MRVITLTLNPAFDVHSSATGLRLYSENFLDITSRDAGGKGINISRALSSLGRDNTAIVLLGRENGKEFYNSLVAEGLSVAPIYTDGRIRENITIHEENRDETRISFGGFTVADDVIPRVRELIGEADSDTVITLTGSIPSGINVNALLELLSDYRSRGARLVIDSRSLTLSEITSIKPWLIKPNKGEAEAYAECEINSSEEASHLALRLCSLGVENVLITLGENGAVLATSDGVLFAKSPNIEPKSTVGAGDSTVAGFIDAFADGGTLTECLIRAVAFGSAACLTIGTAAPRAEDVKRLEGLVEIMKI